MTGDYGCVYTTDVSLDKDGYPRIKHNKQLPIYTLFINRGLAS